MRVPSLSQEDPLEEGMATHFSILAQRIPRTEEPGKLQPMGSQESDTTEATLHTHTPCTGRAESTAATRTWLGCQINIRLANYYTAA